MQNSMVIESGHVPIERCWLKQEMFIAYLSLLWRRREPFEILRHHFLAEQFTARAVEGCILFLYGYRHL